MRDKLVMGSFGLLIPTIIVGITIWTDRTLEFWLSYIKHEPVHISMWVSFAVTVLCNGFILVVNVLTEVLRTVL